MTCTVAGADGALIARLRDAGSPALARLPDAGSGLARLWERHDPAVGRRQGPVSASQAAVVPAELLELDDFESDEDEDDEVEVDEDAGELLDEAPRLSLR
jgi:hypothetical protein